MITRDGDIEYVNNEVGRIVPNSNGGAEFIFEYFYKDYTDNLRMAFTDADNDGTAEVSEILQEAHYYPFGMELKGIDVPVTSPERKEKYNGQEFQDEFGLNWYNFGARFYDVQVARFTGIDPKTESYLGWSGYLYAGNNPVIYIDLNGEGPGDLFKTRDEAAVDFAVTYNDNSIADNLEYAVSFYEVVNDNGDVSFTYTVPNVGKSAGSKPSRTTVDGEKIKRKDVVAEGHTHGAYKSEYDNTDGHHRADDPVDNNDEFSINDESRAEYFDKPSYLASPNGELKVYDPDVHIGKENTVISSNIPSDKDSPNRVNKNDSDSEKYSKTEPVIK